MLRCACARQVRAPDLTFYLEIGVGWTHRVAGRTPLSYAVAMNLSSTVLTLLDLGADINQTMGKSTTALTIAVRNEKLDGTEMVRLLLFPLIAKCVGLRHAHPQTPSLHIGRRRWRIRPLSRLHERGPLERCSSALLLPERIADAPDA